MTVETTDYTPEGKALRHCTPAELLETINAIESHGMLRLHAQDRLMNRVLDEVHSRGLGLYEGNEDDDWDYAITAGSYGQSLPEDAHYHAVSARDCCCERRVWTVDGPYSKVRDEVRAFCDRPDTRLPLTERMKAGGGSCRLNEDGTGPITGFC